MAEPDQMPNLAQRLAVAEAELHLQGDESTSQSESMSMNSEERDSALATKSQEDADRAGSSSSCASDAAAPDAAAPCLQSLDERLICKLARSGQALGSSDRLNREFFASQGSSSLLSAERSECSLGSDEQKASMELWKALRSPQDASVNGEQLSTAKKGAQESRDADQISDAAAKLKEDNAAFEQKIAIMESKHAAETKDLQARLAAMSPARAAPDEAGPGKLSLHKLGVEREQAVEPKAASSQIDALQALAGRLGRGGERDGQSSSGVKAEIVQDDLLRSTSAAAHEGPSGSSSPRRRAPLTVSSGSVPQRVEAAEDIGIAGIASQRKHTVKTEYSHQDFTDELREMRAQLQNRQNEKTQVGDLQMMLDEACDLQLEQTEGGATGSGGTAHLLGKAPVRRRGVLGKRVLSALSKLDAIDEDDLRSIGLDMSCAASGNVSSFDDGQVVGDMTDFDDGIDSKPDENIKSLLQKDVIKEESYEDDEDAQYAAKIACLSEIVKVSRIGRLAAEDQLSRLKSTLAGEDAKNASQVNTLTQRLEAAEARNASLEEELQDAAKRRAVKAESRESEVEDLRQQVSCLKEAKRIAEVRAEDLKRAMATMERKYSHQVEELQQRLKVAASGVSGEGLHSDALASLRQRLKSAEEERNVLANRFEGEEVKWKDYMENMQKESEELKRKHEMELKETTCCLEGEIAELRSASSAQLQELSQARAASSTQPAAGWFGLRCPSRSSSLGHQPPGTTPAFCQEICWQVLNSARDVLALLCSISDYTILEASKEACRTWGSAALQGKSVLTLANGAASAAWLRKAFETHQRYAELWRGDGGPPGFIVRDLGCEAFTTKAGTTFDSSVITAHLPAEPCCRKQAALLVIIEPHHRSALNASSPHSSGSRIGNSRDNRAEERSRRRASASASEVSSSTINPEDSASNILVPRGGMWMH